MAKTLVVITVLAITLIAGCNSAVWGNLAVLAVGIGIFVGTLTLGVPAGKPTSASPGGRADASPVSIDKHLDNQETQPRA